MENPFISRLQNAILSLFCIKYTTASCKKRRYLLYFAVALLTETVAIDIETVSKKEIVQNVIDKINEIYKQIKKNEESPNMEYLFSNLDKKASFDQSVKKMELLNAFENVI
jgi:hypothetical protein